MSAICEDCAPLVFDRYGDGREVRNDGVALCPLHAAAPALLAALEQCVDRLDTIRLQTIARAAIRKAKGEPS